IGKQFALYQYVLPVRLRIILAVTFRRIDDNDAVHPAGDVLGHGIGATVINKDTWVVGMEFEVLAVTRRDLAEFVQNVQSRGMEIHGMAVAIIGMVVQAELHKIALPDAYYRARNGTLVGPHPAGV